MTSLALNNVSLSFADGDERVYALNDVTLNASQGELVAVSGASGSGKSSLLAVAGALRTPESGPVLYEDTDITNASKPEHAEIRRKHLGFVFQQSNLFEALTATDQLMYQAQLAAIPRATARHDAAELLDSVGMSDKADRRPGQLSGGDRQRVDIARALINSPRVILADEPTSGLDASRASDIVQLLRDRTHQRQAATVMVTHHLDVHAEADRVVKIRDHKIINDGITGLLSPPPMVSALTKERCRGAR